MDLEATVESKHLLSRLLDAAAEPVFSDKLSLQVSANIGITFYPQAETVDADQLLRQADQAMYQAKLAGKNRYHIFDAEQDRSVRGHHESLERIRCAILNIEFVLNYQPKVRNEYEIEATRAEQWGQTQGSPRSVCLSTTLLDMKKMALPIAKFFHSKTIACKTNTLILKNPG